MYTKCHFFYLLLNAVDSLQFWSAGSQKATTADVAP